MDGIILKGIGGFYYVETENGVFECKAKGKFRKEGITPLAGDRVSIKVDSRAQNVIEAIHERKNALRRPPVANIDKLFIVVSTCRPVPNTLVVDRMTVLCLKNDIEPIIVFSKTDLKNADELIDEYKKTPFKVFLNTEHEKILDEISGCLCAFTGNSGVGKSTLLNNLCPELNLETKEISQKLGRGRHTTRQAEIFHVGNGMIIDTAGFSSLDFDEGELMPKEDVRFYFPEFDEFRDCCKFTGCSHIGDKGCEIMKRLGDGVISKTRHSSYKFLYNEAKERYIEWKFKKNK